MRIESLDHLVLTVRDIDATLHFYSAVLGMTHRQFDAGAELRHALHYGCQKINLHRAGKEFEPKAERPVPGSADLCFLVSGALADWVDRLTGAGIAIEEGPVPRTGAAGALMSVYIRDPDGNLIELSVRA